MADGIRITPRADLGFPLVGPYMVTVRDHDRPMPPALDGTPASAVAEECPWCTAAGEAVRQHLVKTYHISVAADNTAMVSEGVWNGLQACADNPFELVNVVRKPPAQELTVDARVKKPDFVETLVLRARSN